MPRGPFDYEEEVDEDLEDDDEVTFDDDSEDDPDIIDEDDEDDFEPNAIL